MPGVYRPAYKCQICGWNLSEKSIQQHHVIPKTIAPEMADDQRFIKLLCPSCHSIMTNEINGNLARLAQLKAEGKLQELERECWKIYDSAANWIPEALRATFSRLK